MPKSRSTFSKRQKEQARQQKQREKAERRSQRKQQKSQTAGVNEHDDLHVFAQEQAALFSIESDQPNPDEGFPRRETGE